MKPRNTFKEVKVLNKSFLYPLPVIKEKKYLIELGEVPADFMIYALEKSFVESPDSSLTFYMKNGIHTDGKTPYYLLDLDKVKFNLLKNKNLEPKRSETIETLLNKKILSVLKNEEESKPELIKCFRKQLKCSTCQRLGFQSEELKKLLGLLG